MGDTRQDTRQNKTVAGSNNDIYAQQAGEGPVIEPPQGSLDTEPAPEARQEGTATIRSTDLEKELGDEPH